MYVIMFYFLFRNVIIFLLFTIKCNNIPTVFIVLCYNIYTIKLKIPHMIRKKTKLVGWRIDRELFEFVSNAAKLENRSFSNMLNVLIRNGREFYEKYGTKEVRPNQKLVVRNREQRKKLAAPKWGEEQTKKAYAMLRKEANTLDIGHHVDHLVPICGKINPAHDLQLVCGLHIWYNLRLITAEENLRKGCRAWPHRPNYTEEDINELRKLAKENC